MLELRKDAALNQKSLGAFYTDKAVADFLMWWAVRSATDRVIDPSFGGGVFLLSACERLLNLGGYPDQQVFGVELDPPAHSEASSELRSRHGIPQGHLFLNDFFSLKTAEAPKVDVVIGNPPFIRYQRFTGATRQRAPARAKEQGLNLSELRVRGSRSSCTV